MPEVASHSSPYYFNFKKGNKEKIYLRGLEAKELLMLHYSNNDISTCSRHQEAQNVLNLWVSTGPRDVFTHIQAVLSVSIRCARMGGSIVRRKNVFYRFGQNNQKKYGEYVNIMKILEISPKSPKNSW